MRHKAQIELYEPSAFNLCGKFGLNCWNMMHRFLG
jgi:hypothetical protein